MGTTLGAVAGGGFCALGGGTTGRDSCTLGGGTTGCVSSTLGTGTGGVRGNGLTGGGGGAALFRIVAIARRVVRVVSVNGRRGGAILSE